MATNVNSDHQYSIFTGELSNQPNLNMEETTLQKSPYQDHHIDNISLENINNNNSNPTNQNNLMNQVINISSHQHASMMMENTTMTRNNSVVDMNDFSDIFSFVNNAFDINSEHSFDHHHQQQRQQHIINEETISTKNSIEHSDLSLDSEDFKYYHTLLYLFDIYLYICY